MAGTAPDYDNIRMGGPDGIRIPTEVGKCTFVVTTSQNINAGATTYYTTAGAIPIASGTYVINGAGALAMTLATPTLAQDGATLTIIAGTAHAHTVTTAANKIVPSKDTVTYAAVGDYITLRAVNGLWYNIAIGGPTPAILSEV